MLHITGTDVAQAAQGAKHHPHGFQYVIVNLGLAQTMENPASTKRVVVGPGVWLWELHVSGSMVREYDSMTAIPRELRDGAPVMGGGLA